MHGAEPWRFPVPLTLTLIGALLVQARGWVRLRRAGLDPPPAWQLATFGGGLLFLWIAVGSPLAVLDHQLLTAHMVQHLVLMTVAAPLLLASAPVHTLMSGLPQRLVRTVLRPQLSSAPGMALGRFLAHPVVCWLAGTGVVMVWHVPTLFAATLHAPGWHAFQQLSFLVAGLLFWWPVVLPWPAVARWPRWSMPLYLFFATLPCDALSAFLAFCGRVVYPHYLSAHLPFGTTPLGDQAAAGALMWLVVTVAYLLPAVAITLRILSPARTGRAAEAS
jgi:cytochrome c oxidase assembly factor CtaG